jgi:poly(3-hydroxybutyrate) depolymerase
VIGDGDLPGGEGDGGAGNGDQTSGDGDGGGGSLPPLTGDGPKIPEPSAACPSLMSGTQTIMDLETRIIAGTPDPNKKGPLLIYWHGTGSSPEKELGVNSPIPGMIPKSVQDEIVAEGGMIVAPQSNGQTRDGMDVTYVLGVWYTTHDFSFADLIAACAVKNYNIDPRRIYTTGCSAGGLMAGNMEMSHDSYLAAVSTNSGGIAVNIGAKLADPSHVSPIMFMHGGADDTVVINFQTASENLADIVKPAGGFVIMCNHMMGHCGAPAELQVAAWQFMKDHPFGIAESPYLKSGLPSSFPSYCQIMK